MKGGTNKRLSVIENDIVKILWDVCIKVDSQIVHRRPDIVVLEKNTNKCLIIDVVCPVDNNGILKRNEKLDNYSELGGGGGQEVENSNGNNEDKK